MKNFLLYKLLPLISTWSVSKRSRTFRLYLTAIFFSLGYAIISVKLATINFDSDIGKNEQHKLSKFRQDIVDRNGHVLATNFPSASLFANPTKVLDPIKTIKTLKTVIKDLDEKKMLEEFSKNKTFVWIKRDLSPKLEEDIINLGLPGLYFEREIKRVYTQSKATSHLLGLVDRDNKGISGAEKYFDQYLSSIDSDALQLSIDYRVQNIVSDELDKVISKFSAKGGVGIVADVTTGEILAMVSKPDFDPHNIKSANSEQIFNRATLGAYEIGSSLKAITFAIAFDTDTIQMNDAYNLGNFNIGKFRVKDYHKHDGWNSIPQLFMNSSNIGSGMIALEVGRRNYMEYLSKFGLTDKLEIELPEKVKPLIPDDKKVSDLSLVTMSYGYGYSISPMHFVSAMIPIVNGGYKYPVTIVKKNEEEIKKEKILKDETSINMLKLMRLTVEKGTGRKAAVKGYLVGGKTGTANKLGPKGYLNNSRYSSFIATAPSIDPKFIVFVFLDDPKGIKETFGFATAGFTAAPTAGNIISRVGSLYGIEPYDEEDENIKGILKVEYEVENSV